MLDMMVIAGIEILEVKVGMEMSGAALVIEMLDMMVIMGMEMLDMMGNLLKVLVTREPRQRLLKALATREPRQRWLLAHWVLLTTVSKPLVALLRHQCNARRLVRPFRKGHLLNLVAGVHRIHSMTLGVRPAAIRGAPVGLTVLLVTRLTIQLPRQVEMPVRAPPCDPRPRRSRLGLLASRSLLRMSKVTSLTVPLHR